MNCVLCNLGQHSFCFSQKYNGIDFEYRDRRWLNYMCIFSLLIFRKLQVRGDRNECSQTESACCCSEWFAKCKRLHWSKKTTRIMALNDDGGSGGDDDDDDY
jgi:hypothetical protein